jgi:excisionase family DNA binding protein
MMNVRTEESPRSFLSPREVAELLMVAPVTVRVWAQRGLIKALLTPGGHRRFLRTEVERFARERGLRLKRRAAMRGPRILIVDDDRQLAGYLQALLEGCGSETGPAVTEVAHDGFEAGCKIQLFQPDVMLLDLMMPGIDGFKVCERVKNDPLTRHVRIIAITGYPTPENIQRIVTAGAEACLAKPLDAKTLLAAIDLRVIADAA